MFGKIFRPSSRADELLFGRIISRDPIITISKRRRETPLGIAGTVPDFFRKKHALHLLADTWHSHNEKKLRTIKKDLQRLSRYLVNNHFIYLGNTQYETWLLSKNNISSIHTSSLIAIDESTFKPDAEQLCKIKPAEAVYNARLNPFKRHELAFGLKKVALIYGSRHDQTEQYERLKQAKPDWIFVNNEAGNGQYKLLNKKEVAGVLNQCQVGLCLSAEEGPMRASMEYQLCGLPVVSTQSIGGRDRYFDSYNCIYADSTPKSVTSAVRVFLDNMPDKMEIRRAALRKINFDRNDFVVTINEIVASIYGVSDLFNSCSKIIGYVENLRPASDILGDLSGL